MTAEATVAMGNGTATHEWRLEQLEKGADALTERVERVERAILKGVWLLAGNLFGIILLLLKILWDLGR